MRGMQIGATCYRSPRFSGVSLERLNDRNTHYLGSKMDRKTLLVGVALLVFISIVAAGVFLFSKPASFRGTTYTEPYPPAPEFNLTRANGSSFQLSETRGKVVMLFFGYTSCPDICPTTLAEFKQSLVQLGDKADEVQVLFVTVDPQRDTPERV